MVYLNYLRFGSGIVVLLVIAIAQLTTDGQFLDRIREIIRFFKTA